MIALTATMLDDRRVRVSSAVSPSRASSPAAQDVSVIVSVTSLNEIFPSLKSGTVFFTSLVISMNVPISRSAMPFASRVNSS